ncbi:non-homologous end joining protein Ku [Kitasatospora sp. NPDC001683]
MIAKKVLTFSLVTIPVGIVAATSEHRVPLHEVHAKDAARVRRRKVCEAEGIEIPEAEIARGYDLPTGQTLVLSKQDLEALPMADSREIRVLGFMPAERVDPIHYHQSYYLTAAGPGASRPYALLRAALEESGQVAIARTAIRTRDSLVAIRVRGDVLVMTTLLWPDEVRPTEGLAPETPELRPQEIALARQLMDAYSADFDPAAEEDEYTTALIKVVEAKTAGLPAPQAPDARVLETAPVVDLTALLQQAIARAEQEHPKTRAGRLTKRATKPASAKHSTDGTGRRRSGGGKAGKG